MTYISQTLQFNDKFDEPNEVAELPFGVEYLTTIIDLLIPTSMFM